MRQVKGKPKTDLQYKIINKGDQSCVPKLAGIEVKIKLENCRKNREDVPVHVIYK
jgi:hypothetical protein